MDLEPAVQSFSAYLSRTGRKSTRQRERIVRAFLAAGRHISAEELYRQVRSHDPSVGLVTVYRTLKLLGAAGLATERSFGAGYSRFDPNLAEGNHHHLICTVCGRIEEFRDPHADASGQRAARAAGFIVTESRVELYGTCQACARRKRSSRTAKERHDQPAV